jgi:hypothetical protein
MANLLPTPYDFTGKVILIPGGLGGAGISVYGRVSAGTESANSTRGVAATTWSPGRQ